MTIAEIAAVLVALSLMTIIYVIVNILTGGEISEIYSINTIIVIVCITTFVFGAGYITPTTNTIQTSTAYSYNCQICEEEQLETEEPTNTICKECKEKIKNIKESEE